MKYVRGIGNVLAVVIGSTLLGIEFGWMVGWGVGLNAWAWLPEAK